MDYQIALSPDLGLHPEAFAAAWNATAECRAVSEARVATSTAAQFDPSLTNALMVVLGNVAVGLATNILYDLIKDALAKRGVSRQTEFVQIDRPDGTRLLVVKTAEE